MRALTHGRLEGGQGRKTETLHLNSTGSDHHAMGKRSPRGDEKRALSKGSGGGVRDLGGTDCRRRCVRSRGCKKRGGRGKAEAAKVGPGGVGITGKVWVKRRGRTASSGAFPLHKTTFTVTCRTGGFKTGRYAGWRGPRRPTKRRRMIEKFTGRFKRTPDPTKEGGHSLSLRAHSTPKKSNPKRKTEQELYTSGSVKNLPGLHRRCVRRGASSTGVLLGPKTFGGRLRGFRMVWTGGPCGADGG